MRTEDQGEMGRGSFCSIGVVGTRYLVITPLHTLRAEAASARLAWWAPRPELELGFSSVLAPTLTLTLTLTPIPTRWAPRRRRTWAHVT